MSYQIGQTVNGRVWSGDDYGFQLPATYNKLKKEGAFKVGAKQLNRIGSAVKNWYDKNAPQQVKDAATWYSQGEARANQRLLDRGHTQAEIDKFYENRGRPDATQRAVTSISNYTNVDERLIQATAVVAEGLLEGKVGLDSLTPLVRRSKSIPLNTKGSVGAARNPARVQPTTPMLGNVRIRSKGVKPGTIADEVAPTRGGNRVDAGHQVIPESRGRIQQRLQTRYDAELAAANGDPQKLADAFGRSFDQEQWDAYDQLWHTRAQQILEDTDLDPMKAYLELAENDKGRMAMFNVFFTDPAIKKEMAPLLDTGDVYADMRVTSRLPDFIKEQIAINEGRQQPRSLVSPSQPKKPTTRENTLPGTNQYIDPRDRPRTDRIYAQGSQRRSELNDAYSKRDRQRIRKQLKEEGTFQHGSVQSPIIKRPLTDAAGNRLERSPDLVRDRGPRKGDAPTRTEQRIHSENEDRISGRKLTPAEKKEVRELKATLKEKSKGLIKGEEQRTLGGTAHKYEVDGSVYQPNDGRKLGDLSPEERLLSHERYKEAHDRIKEVQEIENKLGRLDEIELGSGRERKGRRIVDAVKRHTEWDSRMVGKKEAQRNMVGDLQRKGDEARVTPATRRRMTKEALGRPASREGLATDNAAIYRDGAEQFGPKSTKVKRNIAKQRIRDNQRARDAERTEQYMDVFDVKIPAKTKQEIIEQLSATWDANEYLHDIYKSKESYIRSQTRKKSLKQHTANDRSIRLGETHGVLDEGRLDPTKELRTDNAAGKESIRNQFREARRRRGMTDANQVIKDVQSGKPAEVTLTGDTRNRGLRTRQPNGKLGGGTNPKKQDRIGRLLNGRKPTDGDKAVQKLEQRMRGNAPTAQNLEPYRMDIEPFEGKPTPTRKRSVPAGPTVLDAGDIKQKAGKPVAVNERLQKIRDRLKKRNGRVSNLRKRNGKEQKRIQDIINNRWRD